MIKNKTKCVHNILCNDLSLSKDEEYENDSNCNARDCQYYLPDNLDDCLRTLAIRYPCPYTFEDKIDCHMEKDCVECRIDYAKSNPTPKE